MWTTREVLLISIASAIAACFTTFYVQGKFASYIDSKVKSKSENPLLGFMNKDMPSFVENKKEVTQNITNSNNFKHVDEVVSQEIQYHPLPPGAGTRWTPLPL